MLLSLNHLGYVEEYGYSPANYSLPGDPGGLVRVDALLDTTIYEGVFEQSPLVFGAFPSLHSAFAVCVTLFSFHLNRTVGILMIGYTLWMWWATLYFSHHWMVDLLGGGIYAGIPFLISRFYLNVSSKYDTMSLINQIDDGMNDFTDVSTETLMTHQDKSFWKHSSDWPFRWNHSGSGSFSSAASCQTVTSSLLMEEGAFSTALPPEYRSNSNSGSSSPV